ncbi:MAG: hypothetical protein M3O62_07175 [Pseudomonadota bacterium]|nr:hypothetical protein [Pseudomonadota bacterium]
MQIKGMRRWIGLVLTVLVALRAAPVWSEMEPLAVVVAADRASDLIDAEKLALIYMRKKSRWSDGDRIQPVNLPASDPLREQFSEAILKLRPAALEDYWNEQYFHGILPPHVVQSEVAMALFIAQTDGAIGYLRYCTLASGLKVLLVLTPEGQLVPPGQFVAQCRPASR